MDTVNEDQCIFNMKLARMMGLYQILNPDSAKICGYNAYHVVVAAFVSFMFAASMLFPVGLAHLRNDLMAFMYYSGCISNFLLSSYKMGNIIYHSGVIWECIDVTGSDFVTYARYDPGVFRRWRARCSRVTCVYMVIALFAFFCWIFSPSLMTGSVISIRNPDGSYGRYRMNVFNIYLVASHDTYNSNFCAFYVLEMVIGVCYVYCTIVFDVLMLLLCFAISYQLETISDAVGKLGYNCSTRTRPRDDGTRSLVKLKQNRDTMLYNDLITIMTDHKNVIKKLDDFYNIFKPVTLTQIFITSSSHVFIWSIAAMSVDEGDNADSILSFKLFIVLPLINFQLFMTCYLFGTINEKKDSIIFALYSSNWIDMDLKSKKMILYAMIMNNANQLKIKFTNTKIVNLEMFSHTMRFCYSIFSMLINYSKNKMK